MNALYVAGAVYRITAQDGVDTTANVYDMAVKYAKCHAAASGQPVLVSAEVDGERRRTARFLPDGHAEVLPTPTLAAERRMLREFASEMEALGLRAYMSGWSSQYRGGDLWIEFSTEPEPVKGNKAKMEAVEAAGFTPWVYVPYDWGRRRAFKVFSWRKLVITEEDRKEALAV